MSFPCDHSATRASLPAFLQATTFLGFVIFPDEVQAQGRCNGCDTTLAVSVALARGQAVHGLIERARDLAAVTGQPLTDAEEAEMRAAIHEDEPPPVRSAGKVARHLEDLDENFNDPEGADHA